MHIRSFSKSHGPDLRLAAVGGAGEVSTAVANRRLLGPGLEQPHPAGGPPRAAGRPGHDRRAWPRARASTPAAGPAVTDVLDARGVRVTRPTGSTCGWRSPTSVRRAVALAAQGIGVAPGEPFLVRPDADHVRVTIGLVDHDLPGVAAKLTDAAGLPPRSSGLR